MFFINFKIALRNLKRNRGFSVINIGGLAIGLTSCLLLLLYVNYEYSFDQQYKAIDRLYVAELNHSTDGTVKTYPYTPNKVAAAGLQELPGVEAACRVSSNGSNRLFSNENNKFKLNTITADPSFMKMFDYDVKSGNMATALNDPHSLILTASTAKKFFGDQDPIGKSLKWDNRIWLKVTAVISDPPKNQTFQFDAVQTWSFYENTIFPPEKTFEWGAISCMTFFELKPNANVAATDAALRKLIKTHDPETRLEAFLFPFKMHHLYDEFENGKLTGGKVDQVNLFAFLAFCVLLIASINYMNLSTARSEKRAREVGVRKALGSSRKALMGQFVLESLLLSTISMLISFALLELLLPQFNTLLDTAIRIDYSSYTFWGVLISLILITGMLAGSYPAIYLSSFTPIKVLKGFKGAAGGALSIRKLLVVIQFSLSICMIICALVIYTQMQYIKNKPLGFDQNNLVEMELEGNFKDPVKVELLKQELKKSEAVVMASEYAGNFTTMSNNSSDFSWPGKDISDNALFEVRSTGYDYAKTVGSSMVQGRDFSREFPADTATNVILNEAAVKRMGLKNPVGTVINWVGSPPLTIIGVIQDYANGSAGARSLPTIFYYNIHLVSQLMMRLNPNQPLNASVQTVKDISQRLNPSYPAVLEYIDQSMDAKLKTERILSTLSNLFGGFCIFISCLGLLGLALYMAEQRQKEISIRKVLGADLKSILILLNKDFIKLVLIANLIAFPLAYILASKWLQKYDYRIDMNIWPFMLAAMLSIVIALLTVSLQSFKVARANPVDALKYE
ncbi:MAG: ABC transporter permease [Pedobacter sp.]|uniref:ABC transporter permease n=1 Tax=Pedobacter sp. TaxID=1411316 RepID=UPI003398F9C9